MNDRTEFIEAVKAQAFDAEEGPLCEHCKGSGRQSSPNRIVHCLGSFTGATWSVEGAVETIEKARSVEWLNAYIYQLKVVDADGKTWRFSVKRPEGEQS